MDPIRPSEKDLDYVGFTELQILLLKDQPDDIVRMVYRKQLENLMSDNDDIIDF